MKNHIIYLLRLAFVALAAFPAFALAAPPATSPYYTDVASSYVQDQVSEDMSGLNFLLCFVGAMAPNLLVNNGDYIALVDFNSCESNGSKGGRSSNTGVNYTSVQVNSARVSNNLPMEVKVWLDISEGTSTTTVPIFASATQAPSKTFPYGVFRMDYCVQQGGSTCDSQQGYIDASKGGLAYYTLNQNTDGTFNELVLQLSSSSSTNSGSGIVIKNNYDNVAVATTATMFAYSPDYFFRNTGSDPQCFNRSTRYAEESAMRYGLYDAVTGEQFAHQSGFPIEYTDTGTGVTHNGYIGYYGISMQVDVPTGANVYKITYDTNPPTKTLYTLLKTGGKLTKYTTTIKTLSDLNKIPFWYSVQAVTAPIPVTGGSITSMDAGLNYEIYWDDTAQQFFVSGQYNPATGNMETRTKAGSVLNADMVAADINGWGLSAWSQLLGGNFNIKRTDFASLDTTRSTTTVITQTQDVVYPKDFDAINAAGGLQCIGDCPTSAQITTFNTSGGSPFISPGWGQFATLANHTYTLDSATGNMLDGTGAPVVQITASSVTSGKLVTAADMVLIQAAKTAAGCISPSLCFSQSDVDLLPSYYTWQTSSDSWSQMAFLLDGANTVTFYPPLPVNFAVPDTSKYGSLAGSTVSLQYGEFGNLWGIPNKCVDKTTNVDCVFIDDPITPTNDITPSVNQRWIAKFSIPFDETIGVVTAGIDQGAVVKGTPYLVKALDKEIRLAQVPNNICTALGLTDTVKVTKLATSADWLDPRTQVGTKPVLDPLPAPRVIHGVQQY